MSNRFVLVQHQPIRECLAPTPVEADEFERSARVHDREASLHDRLAAETGSYLYLAFLHAAEVHRAAARRYRALAAGVGPGQQAG
jgi:hypothetical protein